MNRSDCWKYITAVVLLALVLPGVQANSDSTVIKASEMLQQIERNIFPGSYEAAMEMETFRPGKPTKNLSFTILAKENLGSLMEITAPSRSKGITFLQKENTLLMYSPRSGSRKAIRLSAQDSFQGSLFANSDVSDSTYSDDYTAHIIGNQILNHPNLGNVETILLEGIASHDKAPYGKIEVWALAETLIPVKFNYYSKSGLLFRIMVLSNIQEIGGALRPTLMHMEAIPEPGSWTEVKITKIEPKNNLSDALFTEANLTR